MALFRALVSINQTSQNPDDVITNQWHFDANTPADLADVQTALEAFYEMIADRMSNLLSPTGITTEWYQLSDPPPRRPVRTDVWSVSNYGIGTMPTEVAIVLSFQAAPISGVNQARRRNRIYIGPISSDQFTGSGLVGESTVDDIRGAAINLLDASNAATEWTWAIFSPTDGTGADVNNGWVDNAWDTQRRRGMAATMRGTWEASP